MPFADQIPTFRRHAGTIKKWLRRALFAIVCLVTLVALVVTEENFRTKRAWEKYRRDAEARGEVFDPAKFAPPPVPDDQNFFMTPLFKPIYTDEKYREKLTKRLSLQQFSDAQVEPEFQGWPMGDFSGVSNARVNLSTWAKYLKQPEVLTALKQLDPEMNEIAAARRPSAYLPLPDDNRDFGLRYDCVDLMTQSARLFALRAIAELAASQTDRALADVQVILRLAEAMKEASFLEQWHRLMICKLGWQVVWEGLTDRRWTAEQLATLQTLLLKTDFVTSGRRSLEADRAMAIQLGETIAGDPAKFYDTMGWRLSSADRPSKAELRIFSYLSFILYRDLPALADKWQEKVSQIDLGTRRVHPSKASDSDERDKLILEEPSVMRSFKLLDFAFDNTMVWAWGQTMSEEAAVACALERYWLANGRYPEKLDALVPQFMERIPYDIITGGPLHYKIAPNGRPLLYAVGRDEKDDQGTVNKEYALFTTGPDWVWQYPAKP